MGIGEETVAILRLKAVMGTTAKEISTEANKVLEKAEKNIQNINLDEKLVGNLNEVFDIFEKKLKGTDFTRPLMQLATTFANANSSAEDYQKTISNIYDQTKLLGSMSKEQLGNLGKLNPSRQEKIIDAYSEYTKVYERVKKLNGGIKSSDILKLSGDDIESFSRISPSDNRKFDAAINSYINYLKGFEKLESAQAEAKDTTKRLKVQSPKVRISGLRSRYEEDINNNQETITSNAINMALGLGIKPTKETQDTIMQYQELLYIYNDLQNAFNKKGKIENADTARNWIVEAQNIKLLHTELVKIANDLQKIEGVKINNDLFKGVADVNVKTLNGQETRMKDLYEKIVVQNAFEGVRTEADNFRTTLYNTVAESLQKTAESEKKKQQSFNESKAYRDAVKNAESSTGGGTGTGNGSGEGNGTGTGTGGSSPIIDAEKINESTEAINAYAKAFDELKYKYSQFSDYAISIEEVKNRFKELFKKGKELGGLTDDKDVKDFLALGGILDSKGLLNKFKPTVEKYRDEYYPEFANYFNDIKPFYSELESKVQKNNQQQISEQSATQFSDVVSEENEKLQAALEEKQRLITQYEEQIKKLEDMNSNSVSYDQYLDARNQAIRMGEELGAYENQYGSIEELDSLIKDYQNRIDELQNKFSEIKNPTSDNNQGKELKDIDVSVLEEKFENIITKFNDGLNKAIVNFGDSVADNAKDFENTLSNIDYSRVLKSLRTEFLIIVEQFKNSINGIGGSNSSLFNNLDSWNKSGAIMNNVSGADFERGMFANLSNGATSISHVLDAGYSFDLKLYNELLRMSVGIDQQVSQLYDTFIHSHPVVENVDVKGISRKTFGSNRIPSLADFKMAYEKMYDDGIRKMMVESNGNYSLFDFSSLDKKQFGKFIGELQKQFDSSEFFKKDNGSYLFTDKILNRDMKVDYEALSEAKTSYIKNALKNSGLSEDLFTTGSINDFKNLGEQIGNRVQTITDATKNSLGDIPNFNSLIVSLEDINGNIDAFLKEKNVIDSLVESFDKATEAKNRFTQANINAAKAADESSSKFENEKKKIDDIADVEVDGQDKNTDINTEEIDKKEKIFNSAVRKAWKEYPRSFGIVKGNNDFEELASYKSALESVVVDGVSQEQAVSKLIEDWERASDAMDHYNRLMNKYSSEIGFKGKEKFSKFSRFIGEDSVENLKSNLKQGIITLDEFEEKLKELISIKLGKSIEPNNKTEEFSESIKEDVARVENLIQEEQKVESPVTQEKPKRKRREATEEEKTNLAVAKTLESEATALNNATEAGNKFIEVKDSLSQKEKELKTSTDETVDSLKNEKQILSEIAKLRGQVNNNSVKPTTNNNNGGGQGSGNNNGGGQGRGRRRGGRNNNSPATPAIDSEIYERQTGNATRGKSRATVTDGFGLRATNQYLDGVLQSSTLNVNYKELANAIHKNDDDIRTLRNELSKARTNNNSAVEEELIKLIETRQIKNRQLVQRVRDYLNRPEYFPNGTPIDGMDQFNYTRRFRAADFHGKLNVKRLTAAQDAEKKELDTYFSSLFSQFKSQLSSMVSLGNKGDISSYKNIIAPNSNTLNYLHTIAEDYASIFNDNSKLQKMNSLWESFGNKTITNVQASLENTKKKYLETIETLKQNGTLTSETESMYNRFNGMIDGKLSSLGNISDFEGLQRWMRTLPNLVNYINSFGSEIKFDNKQYGAIDKKFSQARGVYNSSTMASEYQKEVNALFEKWKKLKDARDKLSETDVSGYRRSSIAIKALEKELDGLISKYQDFNKVGKNGNLLNIGDVNRDNFKSFVTEDLDRLKASGSIDYYKLNDYDPTSDNITAIARANGKLQEYKYTLNDTAKAMNRVNSEVTKESKSFHFFGSTLKEMIVPFTYMFSLQRLVTGFVNKFKEGVNTLKAFDSALTNISYTMDVTSEQLKKIGESAIQMSNDLGVSLDNSLKIYQIYANMNTTAEEIAKTGRATAILANLSGSDASTAADQVQGIIQQFNMLDDAATNTADSCMHIVDVLNTISANVSLDYAKGISVITEAVTATGQVAHDAGMSYEELAAISAKMAERTREDGSTIGNALKTMFTRISKVAKMPSYADEIDNETVSKAAEALNEIGINVYKADGEFKDITQTLTELNNKWDDLTDAQKSYISYQIAATRQSSKFKSMLEAWSDAMSLADEAANNSEGSSEENQKKYLESYNGKIQQITNNLNEFFLDLLNSDGFKRLLDWIIDLTGNLVKLEKKIGPLTTILTMVGGLAGIGGIKTLFKNTSEVILALTRVGVTKGLFSGSTLKSVNIFAKAMDTARDNSEGLYVNIKNIGKGIGKTALKLSAIAAIIVAISVVVKSIQDYKQALKDANSEYEDGINELKSQINLLKEQEKIISDVNSTIDEISNARNKSLEIESDILEKYKDDYSALSDIKNVIVDVNSSADDLYNTIQQIEWTKLKQEYDKRDIYGEYQYENNPMGWWNYLTQRFIPSATRKIGSILSGNLNPAEDYFSNEIDQAVYDISVAGIKTLKYVKNNEENRDLLNTLDKLMPDEFANVLSDSKGLKLELNGTAFDKLQSVNKMLSYLENTNQTDNEIYTQLVKSKNKLDDIIDSNKQLYESYILNNYIYDPEAEESDVNAYNELLSLYQEVNNSDEEHKIDARQDFVNRYLDIQNDETISNAVKNYLRQLYSEYINYVLQGFLDTFIDEGGNIFIKNNPTFGLGYNIDDAINPNLSDYTVEEWKSKINSDPNISKQINELAAKYGFDTVDAFFKYLVGKDYMEDEASKRLLDVFGESNIEYLKNKYGEDSQEYKDLIAKLRTADIQEIRDLIKKNIDSYDLDPSKYFDVKDYMNDLEKVHRLTDMYYANDRELLTDLIEMGDEFLNSLERNNYKYSEAVSKVQKTQTSFDSLGKIYLDITDYITEGGSSFDYSALTNDDFIKNFSGLNSYEDFVKTIVNNPAGMTKDAQDYFNKIATEVLFTSEAFDNLDSSSINFVTNYLTQMGVVNASEVALMAMNAQLDYQALALENSAKGIKMYSTNLNEATLQDILNLRNEEGTFDDTTKAIVNYWMARNSSDFNNIITAASCEQLIALAEAANISAAAIARLQEIQANIDKWKIEYDIAIGVGNSALAKESKEKIDYYLSEQSNIRSQLEKDISDYYTNVSFVDYKAPNDDSASKAADKAKEELDKAIEYLEKQLDANQITFSQYLNARLDLIQDYYDKGLIKAADYYAELEEYYKAQLDGYDNAIEAIDNLIDEEIKRINDEKQALSDANDERQKAIDLQKAEYELARSQNQRSRLIYQNGQLVYANDPKAIRDAEKELADQKYQEQIDALDKMVERLEKYKELWDKIPDSYEKAQKKLIAADLFGPDWEDKILNLDMDLYNNFTPDYADAEQNMRDAAAMAAANSLQDAADSLRTIANNLSDKDSLDSKHGYTLKDFNGQQIGFFETIEAAKEAAKVLGGAAENWDIEEIDAISEEIIGLGKSLSTLANVDFLYINTNLSDVSDSYNAIGNAIPEGSINWSYKTDLDELISEIRGSSNDYDVSFLKDNLNLLISNPWDSDTWINSIMSTLSNDGFLMTTDQILKFGELLRNNNVKSVDDIIALLTDSLKSEYQNENSLSNMEGFRLLIETIKGSAEDSAINDLIKNLNSIADGTIDFEKAASNIENILLNSGFEVTAQQVENLINLLKEDPAVPTIDTIEKYVEQALLLNTAQSNVNTTQQSGVEIVDEATKSNKDYTQSLNGVGESVDGLIEPVSNLQVTFEDASSIIGERIETEIVDKLKEVNKELIEASNNLEDFKDNGKIDGSVPKITMTKEMSDSIHRTHNFTGTAYADGNWTAGSKGTDGLSLVGELGPEIRVRDGQYEVLGGNGAEFTDVRKDDIIFNHKQSKALLENGHINSRGKAYAQGKFTPLSNLSGGNFDLYKSLNIIADNIPDIKNSITKLVGKVTSPAFAGNSSSPTITVNNPTFTCPGVTSEEVMKSIQNSFTGLLNNAYQQVMK